MLRSVSEFNAEEEQKEGERARSMQENVAVAVCVRVVAAVAALEQRLRTAMVKRAGEGIVWQKNTQNNVFEN